MSVPINSLTKPQQRLWRAAQAYARSVAVWQRAYMDYEHTGDPGLVRVMEPKAARARERLITHIANTVIVEPLE